MPGGSGGCRPKPPRPRVDLRAEGGATRKPRPASAPSSAIARRYLFSEGVSRSNRRRKKPSPRAATAVSAAASASRPVIRAAGSSSPRTATRRRTRPAPCRLSSRRSDRFPQGSPGELPSLLVPRQAEQGMSQLRRQDRQQRAAFRGLDSHRLDAGPRGKVPGDPAGSLLPRIGDLPTASEPPVGILHDPPLAPPRRLVLAERPSGILTLPGLRGDLHPAEGLIRGGSVGRHSARFRRAADAKPSPAGRVGWKPWPSPPHRTCASSSPTPPG